MMRWQRCGCCCIVGRRGVFDELQRIYREGLGEEQVRRRMPVRKF